MEEKAPAFPIIIFARNEEYAWINEARSFAARQFPGKRSVIRTPRYHSPRDMEPCEVIIVQDANSDLASDYRKIGARVVVPNEVELAPTGQKPVIQAPVPEQIPMSEKLKRMAAENPRPPVQELDRAQLLALCAELAIPVVGTGIRGYITKADLTKALKQHGILQGDES